jgi:hypothetical protein
MSLIKKEWRLKKNLIKKEWRLKKNGIRNDLLVNVSSAKMITNEHIF